MAQRRFCRAASIGSINQARPSPDLAICALFMAAQQPGLIETTRSDWRQHAV